MNHSKEERGNQRRFPKAQPTLQTLEHQAPERDLLQDAHQQERVQPVIEGERKPREFPVQERCGEHKQEEEEHADEHSPPRCPCARSRSI